MMRTVVALLLVICGSLAWTGIARAEVKTEEVDYRHDGVALLGFKAWDDAVEGKRPGVLIVHAWRGHSDYVRERARQLAKMGYVAFALDMYGKGVLAKTNQEAAKLAGGFKDDRPLMRARARAGLDVLRDDARVDIDRIAAIGYCFGGTTVLELARDGAPIAGVVSFHGGLETPKPEATKDVRARILVAHGGDDPFVPPEHLQAFWKEMKDAGADYQILILSGAVHSFTDKGAGNDPKRGAAYNEKADKRSWEAMKRFFKEVLAK